MVKKWDFIEKYLEKDIPRKIPRLLERMFKEWLKAGQCYYSSKVFEIMKIHTKKWSYEEKEMLLALIDTADLLGKGGLIDGKHIEILKDDRKMEEGVSRG